ncbi:dihydropteroate synthase [Photobacterium damselae]|uniref:Dihydropteroate synthase n=1 Tax=Photobacterium damselae subsp. damselae TaxID=85581 RepID=A0AAE8V3W4_PHODD|nr:dihydropteroate synthase [Photobacterium damselae]AWK82708.1 dihydropteroate synthase [Photobacterium damselae]KAB1184715.1 dihydropteroate synthase [Photobacterium damselae subsp. damselae]MCG3816739.1 dihydropteroate synthase [Photobacterium damselae]NVO74598.1 dihydropteroate synthase [Photobacterium damselae subsp. damselae]PSB79004.1 dihydropteroate synthase [Photobacterium damselae subsp. damselae]
MILQSRSKILELTSPHVMGILNVTPDSFSDGGRFNHLDTALFHAEEMIDAGATFIDIGGESTRPGAADVSIDEELARVIPVVEAISNRFDCWISIDTSKAQVMTEAVKAGADLINDIRALREPGALEAAAKSEVPICLMHMQGQPRTMQTAPQYDDLLVDIEQFLLERINACEVVGISKQKLILDPGFGFGKTIKHNYQLLENLENFHRFGLPILAGMSRKSMIYKLFENKRPEDCLAGSLACATIAAMKGAQIIRVHDVKETVEAVRICHETVSSGN